MFKGNVVLLIILSLYVTPALACSCEAILTAKEGLQDSDIVLSGKVIKRIWTTNYDSLGINNPNKEEIAVYTVEVEKVYKGKNVADEITIITIADEDACGYAFEEGKKYMIYGNDSFYEISNKNYYRNYFTHKCTRTRLWSKSEESNLEKAIN